MALAAKKCGIKEDFAAWCDTWLKTAGMDIIYHNITEKDGKIEKFEVVQEIGEAGAFKNCLRQQAYQVAFLDENMNVTYTHKITTSEKESKLVIAELAGK